MKKPLGVVLLAIMNVIAGILGVIGGVFFLGLSASGSPSLSQLTGAACLVLAALSFACVYGLWTLRGWAWYVTLLFAFVSIALRLALLFRGGIALKVGDLAIIGLAVVIIVYLLRPKVRRLFS